MSALPLLEALAKGNAVVSLHMRAGEMLYELVPCVRVDLCPGLARTLLLHVAAVQPDEEVVEAHALNLGLQLGRKVITQSVDLIGAIGSEPGSAK